MAAESKRVVAFDLGGVMVRVAYEWRAAVEHSGCMATQNLDSSLGSCPTFEPFQAGRISLERHLAGLASYLGLGSNADALRVHQSILLDAYDGTLELIEDLHAQGLTTACLSNTNAPHWEVMERPENYPAIASIQVPVLSHVVNAEKPHREIYEAFEQLVGVQGELIVFFDDLLANVMAAREMGWSAHLIDPKGEPATQMRLILTDLGVLKP